ncbi:MAG: S-methyl-5-thioribose-1-phosphate isomerase [Actinomycetia bacterium]|nr:S-methyl-5-thioribose-1-phosphate isomerase [Actinomycetes bacterium]
MGDRNLTLKWKGTSLELIDQRKLPFREEYLICRDAGSTARAIRDMVVRGAPAIGVAAAYGVTLAANQYTGDSKDEFLSLVRKGVHLLSKSRPTAVNLFWALSRMEKLLDKNIGESIDHIKQVLETEAKKIEQEDIETNKAIGRNGLIAIRGLAKNKLSVLTHCNAGALATAGYGTALGVIRSLHENHRIERVLVDETRPYLQGARLTSWELYQEGIPCTVITDNMAAFFMSRKEVNVVVVGADRVAKNGDSANKIGTLGLSVLARHYRIPFFIAAPVSTIDFDMHSGDQIPIEQRDGREVREVMGTRIIPDYIPVENPSFDVTSSKDITGIITEKGTIYPPYVENIAKLEQELV